MSPYSIAPIPLFPGNTHSLAIHCHCATLLHSTLLYSMSPPALHSLSHSPFHAVPIHTVLASPRAAPRSPMVFCLAVIMSHAHSTAHNILHRKGNKMPKPSHEINEQTKRTHPPTHPHPIQSIILGASQTQTRSVGLRFCAPSARPGLYPLLAVPNGQLREKSQLSAQLSEVSVHTPLQPCRRPSFILLHAGCLSRLGWDWESRHRI